MRNKVKQFYSIGITEDRYLSRFAVENASYAVVFIPSVMAIDSQI
jgi:hypothetical protein